MPEATVPIETQTHVIERRDVATQTIPHHHGVPGCPEGQTTVPQRDSELWFEDGNLLLLARDTEFRVYKGILTSHSSVFKEILAQGSYPITSSPPEMTLQPEVQEIGGQICTVIHLPDSPEDLRHFLRVFFSGDTLNIWALEPTIHQLSAYIRLGTKYGCEQMVQLSLAYLKKWYPETRDDWFTVTTLHPPKCEGVHIIAVVNLARLTNATALLPTALMVCCTLGAEIVTGFAREDGTRETLSPEDLGRVFAAKAKLLQANAKATHSIFRQTVFPNCKRAKACTAVLYNLLSGLVDDELVIDSLRWSSLWETYTDKIDVDGKDFQRQLCSSCYTMVTSTRTEEFQRQLFNDLPSMMGVTVENWAGKLVE